MFEKNNIAIANATKLIDKYCIKSPVQYSIEEILNAEGLFYTEEKLEGFAGNIVFSNKNGVITVNSSIANEGQKRFTAVHELGHFENEKIKFKACTFEDILGIKKNAPRETAANDFAAELLMHRPWFTEFAKNKKLNAQLLSVISEYFNVSLTAATIRYRELEIYPIALIMSKAGKVIWSSISEYFTFHWIPNGYKVNNNSYAYNFFIGEQIPENTETILADAWFLEDRNYKKNYFLNELNIPMPNYNSVMTVLYE